MAGFSPSDAALEGFRLTRERPGALLTWSALYLVGMVLIALAMMASLGGAFIELAKNGKLMEDPKAVAEVLTQSWPAFVVVLLMTLLLHSTVMGAIFRIIMRPEEKGFAHLKLGADELRLMAVNLIMVLLGMVFLVLGLLVAGMAAATGSAGGYAAGLAIAVLTLWIGVRMSLVTPLTFDRRRIDLRSAWRITRGHFWPLLGTIVLAVIFYVMVWVLMTIIAFAIVELAGGNQAVKDIANVTPVTVVALLVTMVVQLLLQILQIVMIYAPFAVAYRQITGDHRLPEAAA